MMKELGISKGDVISINGGRETFSIVDNLIEGLTHFKRKFILVTLLIMSTVVIFNFESAVLLYATSLFLLIYLLITHS